MPKNQGFDYKLEADRYSHYYRELQRFYQKPVTQVSLAVLFTLATIIFFAVFAIKPTLETVSELLRKIEDQKEVLAKAQQKSAALNTAQQQLDLVREYEPILQTAFPDKLDIQNLLVQVESLASETGIPISMLRISDIVYPEKSQKDFYEISFTLSYDTSYMVSRQFIEKLSHLPRYFSIDTASFQLKEADKRTDSSAPSQSITTTLRCTAYKSPETSK